MYLELLIISVVLFFGAAIFVGCNKNEETKTPCQSKKIGISNVSSANTAERNIAIHFIENNKTLISKFFKESHYFKSEKAYSSIKVVKYSNLRGKAIIIRYDDVTNKTGLKDDEEPDTLNAIILPTSDSNVVLGNIEYNRTVNGKFYEVKTQANGIDWFKAIANKKTKKIVSLKFYNMKSSLSEKKPTFAQCVKTALDACASDGVCAFECGAVMEYCLSAIVLACLYVSA